MKKNTPKMSGGRVLDRSYSLSAPHVFLTYLKERESLNITAASHLIIVLF